MIDPNRDARWYERRKRALVVAALAHATYPRVFEPACGYGALTRMLGERCDTLFAVDADATSLQAAERMYDGRADATFRCARLPDAWPEGPFDLIVLSEWLYYLSNPEREKAYACIANSLAPDGDVIAVHWRHAIPECSVSAWSIHDAVGLASGGHRYFFARDDDFVLDAWTRRRMTLAQEEGLP